MIDIKFIKKENRAVAYDNETEIGECKFIESAGTWNIIHTGVNSKYQGQGIARRLVECIIEDSKKHSKNLIAECSYAKKLIENK